MQINTNLRQTKIKAGQTPTRHQIRQFSKNTNTKGEIIMEKHESGLINFSPEKFYIKLAQLIAHQNGMGIVDVTIKKISKRKQENKPA